MDGAHDDKISRYGYINGAVPDLRDQQLLLEDPSFLTVFTGAGYLTVSAVQFSPHTFHFKASRWTTGGSGFDFRPGERTFLISTTSSLALGPTWPPFQIGNGNKSGDA